MRCNLGVVFAVALSLLTAAGCSEHNAETGAAGLDATTRRLLAASEEGQNWLTYGRDYSETRHSPLDGINPGNVGRLGIAWYHDLDTNRGQEATPIIVDGTMYTSSAWSKVQAFDAVTGKLKWQFDPEVPGKVAVNACCDVVNRGVAYWEGKVFVGTLDGRLIAIDAGTGKQVWSVVTVDQTKPYTITGAPRVIKGRVIIGNGGAEMGVRGYVSAYDGATGRKLWRFYTVPGEPGKRDGEVSDDILEQAAKGWHGKWWSDGGGGGGTVWDAMAYDPDLDLLYIGVGNGSYWDQVRRSDGKGDNLFVGSIVALRPDTGKYVWHFQETPGDQWDYTATQHMILANLTIDGKNRKVLMQAPKNGYFFVLDRATGELISAKPYTAVNWSTGYDLRTRQPKINPAALYSQQKSTWVALPGALGAHNWQPMAFNPATGLVYIPAQEVGFVYKSDPDFKRHADGFNIGLDLNVADLPDDKAVQDAVRKSVKGTLIAWDPVRQKQVWSIAQDSGWNGGILSTAGGLVFQGDTHGMLSAYDAAKGSKLWSYDLQTGVMAPPVTWSRNGKQYVTVVAGWGGAYPMFMGGLSWNGNRPGVNRSRVITFKLDGDKRLPAVETTERGTLQAGLAGVDPAIIELGRRAYNRTCTVCHGGGAISGGIVPDLRYSPATSDPAMWTAILVDGVLEQQGMVSFKRDLSVREIEAIRLFIADRARIAQQATDRKAAAGGKSD